MPIELVWHFEELLRLGTSEGCDLISPQFGPENPAIEALQCLYNGISLTLYGCPPSLSFGQFLTEKCNWVLFYPFHRFETNKRRLQSLKHPCIVGKVLIDQVCTKMVLLPVVPLIL
ncbi:hypothetical protein TNCV_3003531 [Trichonephila clavipes]|nr:hypothetical protein TNCV_3003531 [Trichonephila clavipes]